MIVLPPWLAIPLGKGIIEVGEIGAMIYEWAEKIIGPLVVILDDGSPF